MMVAASGDCPMGVEAILGFWAAPSAQPHDKPSAAAICSPVHGRRLVVRSVSRLATAALMAMLFAAPGTLHARDRTLEVMGLDAILKAHPLPPGEPTADIVASRRAGKGELQIVVARKIPLHIHDQDHVVFVERGTGTARIEKTGDENLVLLVVTTPSRVPAKFFE